MRFFRPQALQVRITGIAPSPVHVADVQAATQRGQVTLVHLWDVTVSRKVVRTPEVAPVSLTRGGDCCTYPLGIIIHSHDELLYGGAFNTTRRSVGCARP